ncbi:MAG: hypothetical protein ACLSVD_04730 [Eggerthellaceae bacterium]
MALNAAWGERIAAELKGAASPWSAGDGGRSWATRTEAVTPTQAGRVPAVVPRSHDFTSLRSWLGFGDWLPRSDAFWS